MIALKALGLFVRQSIPLGKPLPGRAKEDAAEDDDQSRGKDERVKGHLVFRVDFGEEATCWKSSVSVTSISIRHHYSPNSTRELDVPSESICHTTACGHDTGRREKQTNQREPLGKS